MNAALMKRLFRTISAGNPDDLKKIAFQIIDEESKKGHVKLVSELTSLTRNFPSTDGNFTLDLPKHMGNALTPLPKNKRMETDLATYVPIDELEHEMILPLAVEERFRRIEREYAARERLALYGLQPRKKILLYGPPGCGKTLGAQRLAWNSGLPMLKVRFDSVVSSYLGETASNLRSIFDAAEKSPCLLFIDECDSLAQSRTSSQDVGEIKRVVNSFLQLLDEYNAQGLLVAATNLNEQLDHAIWRRFDEVFEVPKPGYQEIKELFQTTLSIIRFTRIDWELTYEVAKGLSSAHIVRAAKDAVKRAIMDGIEMVNQEMVIDAIKEIRGELSE